MGHFSIVVVLFFLAFQGEGSLWAGEGPVRAITVYGSVTGEAIPDLIIWQIQLSDTDKKIGEAKKRSDEKVKAILALAKKLGVPENDLSTGSLRVDRKFEMDQRYNPGKFLHFKLDRSITIHQRDLKRFDEFFEALLASAEMDVSFSTEASLLPKLRSDLRLKAVQIAKEKAMAMAQTLGAKLGPVLSIQEELQEMFNPFSNASISGPRPQIDQGSETFVPGALSGRATVKVTFSLE